MTDRAALYAAVCATPDDDTVRLVLADWLEENGEAKRAEFVRARVAYDTADEADTPGAAFYRHVRDDGMEHDRVDWSACDPGTAALFAAWRAVERHDLNLSAKSEGTPKLKGVSFFGHVRGFFYGVNVDDGETFARHAAAIFRAAPITEVRFNDLTADGAAAVAGSGYYDRVRSLDLESATSPEAVRVLGGHPAAAGVRELALGGDGNPERVLEELAGAKHFTGVRILVVSEMDEGYQRNRRVDGAFADVLRRTKYHTLEKISAWGNGLSDETTRALADGKYAKLRHLDLSMNWVTADGAHELARAKNLGGLRHLELSSNNVEHGNAAGALIASPALKKLTVLNLESNQFSGLGPKALPADARGPTLRALNLNGCNLWPSGAVRLFACPSARGLWLLDAASTDLDDKAAVALAKAPMDRLAALNVGGNAITAKGLKAIAESPLAPRLQWLDVSGTQGGPAGAKVLAEAANLTGLKWLSYSGRGVAQLKKRFGKTAVEGR